MKDKKENEQVFPHTEDYFPDSQPGTNPRNYLRASASRIIAKAPEGSTSPKRTLPH